MEETGAAAGLRPSEPLASDRLQHADAAPVCHRNPGPLGGRGPSPP